MVSPFHTHEARWFIPGVLPQTVQAWFKAFGKRVVQPPRVDQYLLGTDATLGIKTREGSLEVKQRSTDRGEFTFRPGITGRVESWVKWSFPLATSAAPINLDAANWMPVTKVRQLLLYTFSEQGEINLNPPGEYPTPFIGLELTELQLAEKESWWTVGLELNGPPESDHSDLLRLAEHVFQSPPAELAQAQSLSYPAWLKMVFGK